MPEQPVVAVETWSAVLENMESVESVLAQPDPPGATETVTAAEELVADLSTTIFGRVQVVISPVADFDRLLSLDGALAGIEGVKSVTLADYAREEVAFRLELEKPFTAGDLAARLSENAGLPASVAEASETALSLRLA
jgi:hypothetical protein